MPDDHYFTEDPSSPSQPRELIARLRGREWRFVVDNGVFSPDHIDPGSRLLIEAMDVRPGDRVLDLGAGYGPVGLVAARLAAPDGTATLVEVNRRAAALCEQNARLNLLDNVRVLAVGSFTAEDVGPRDVVVCNPPMKAGWKVVQPLLEAAAACLVPGGRFWLVGNKHVGLGSLEKRLAALVGPVTTADRGGGYHVILAVRERGDG
ncbi:MAG: class I SAM-dependent methyltransferase [Armatimonadetes bacterium]|nr:class I SAM-dependent methyltransferase [Armatimonadota bacterium]